MYFMSWNREQFFSSQLMELCMTKMPANFVCRRNDLKQCGPSWCLTLNSFSKAPKR